MTNNDCLLHLKVYLQYFTEGYKIVSITGFLFYLTAESGQAIHTRQKTYNNRYKINKRMKRTVRFKFAAECGNSFKLFERKYLYFNDLGHTVQYWNVVKFVCEFL